MPARVLRAGHRVRPFDSAIRRKFLQLISIGTYSMTNGGMYRSLSKKAIAQLGDTLQDMCMDVACKAGQIATYSHRSTISDKHVEAAVMLVCQGSRSAKRLVPNSRRVIPEVRTGRYLREHFPGSVSAKAEFRLSQIATVVMHTILEKMVQSANGKRQIVRAVDMQAAIDSIV